jgi:peptide-methionine (R)-S-oxide reductase
MAHSPEPAPAPEPGGKLRLSRTARAIIIGLAVVEMALFLAWGLPRWGGLTSASAAGGRGGSSAGGSRAEGQHKARHGPGQKDNDAAKVDDADNAGDAAADANDQDEAGDDDSADNDENTTGEDGRLMNDPEKLEALKKKLSDEQLNVCFLKGTEPPFSGKYYHLKDPGEYRCAVCGQPLFESDTKFDSGTGWPSFWEMAFPGAVSEVEDNSHGMRRIEVTCSSCGSHLGHVFPDGPEPTGLRYCINSLSLEFIPAEQLEEERAAKAGSGAVPPSGGQVAPPAGP